MIYILPSLTIAILGRFCIPGRKVTAQCFLPGRICMLLCLSAGWGLVNPTPPAGAGKTLILFCIIKSLAFGILMLATLLDMENCRIERIVWGVFLLVTPGIILYLCKIRFRCAWGVVWQWILFVLLQYLLFARMYGLADCHAFCSCAVLLAASGRGITSMLVHMLCSIVLLGLVQWAKGNVNKRGNLKEPVAFIPYITVAFLVVYGLRDFVVCGLWNLVVYGL